MKTTIYGKDDCESCQLAKMIMVNAEYKHHTELFDNYEPDKAAEIVSNSGGLLPIIIIEGSAGVMILGASKSSYSNCKDGSCIIKVNDKGCK